MNRIIDSIEESGQMKDVVRIEKDLVMTEFYETVNKRSELIEMLFGGVIPIGLLVPFMTIVLDIPFIFIVFFSIISIIMIGVIALIVGFPLTQKTPTRNLTLFSVSTLTIGAAGFILMWSTSRQTLYPFVFSLLAQTPFIMAGIIEYIKIRNVEHIVDTAKSIILSHTAHNIPISHVIYNVSREDGGMGVFYESLIYEEKRDVFYRNILNPLTRIFLDFFYIVHDVGIPLRDILSSMGSLFKIEEVVLKMKTVTSKVIPYVYMLFIMISLTVWWINGLKTMFNQELGSEGSVPRSSLFFIPSPEPEPMLVLLTGLLGFTVSVVHSLVSSRRLTELWWTVPLNTLLSLGLVKVGQLGVSLFTKTL